jgi:histone H4
MGRMISSVLGKSASSEEGAAPLPSSSSPARVDDEDDDPVSDAETVEMEPPTFSDQEDVPGEPVAAAAPREEGESEKPKKKKKKKKKNAKKTLANDVVVAAAYEDVDVVMDEGPSPPPPPTVRAPTGVGLGKGKGAGGGGKVRPKRHSGKNMLVGNLERISKPSIRRLARRAGVKRMGGGSEVCAREALRDFVRTQIRDAVFYTDHARRKTVTATDVVRALKRNGRTLYGF